MAKLKSYFFTSFRETAEEKDETNEEEEKTREGADAPFHHYVQKNLQLPTCTYTYIDLYLCMYIYLRKYTFAKYIQSVHHALSTTQSLTNLKMTHLHFSHFSH